MKRFVLTLSCLAIVGAWSGVALPVNEQLAMTDAEIEQQIEQALERGRAQQKAAAPPRAAEPARIVQTEGMTRPRVEARSGFTAYHFSGDLANQQVYRLALSEGSVWVGTSSGLVRFEPERDRWTLIPAPPESGARGMPRVVSAGGRLAVQLWEYPQPHHANPKGAWWYEIATGRWARIGDDDFLEPLYWDGAQLWLRRGHRLIRLDPSTGKQRVYDEKDTPILKALRINALQVSGYEAWICGSGVWDDASKRLEGGGVLKLHLLTDRWHFYTVADGLGDPFCSDIHVDVDQVWVSHWERGTGLSRFGRAQYRWEAVPRAVNQTIIGGPKLAVDGERVWIGQQNGIAWFDTQTRNAFLISEDLGLPGYITGGLVVDRDAVWAGMYAYGGQNFQGVRAAGLVLLKRAASKETRSDQDLH